jgi:uncharacterized protein DUF5939
MSEAEILFAALRQSTGGDEVAMLERMVRDAPDHALNKMNALDLAAKEGVGEERLYRRAPECPRPWYFRDVMERNLPKLRRRALR